MRASRTIILFGLIALCKLDYSPEIEKYINFLSTQNLNAKEYIFKLWETNDIIIICERGHPEITQYDLFLSIANDRRFYYNRGYIFTEIGTVSNLDTINRFIKSNFNSKSELYDNAINIHRDLVGVDRVIWDKYNYYYFITELNKINQRLPDSLKVNLYPIDCASPKWSDISKTKEIRDWTKKTIPVRDSLMAINIIDRIKKIEHTGKKGKYLVILNNRHAFSQDVYHDNGVGYEANAARFLFDRYPERIANVFLNWYGQNQTVGNSEPFSSFHPIQDGKWDAAFKIAEKESIGFDFENSPFGIDTFDFRANHGEYKYQDLFTGMIFYMPIEKHIAIWGIPNIVNDSFRTEFYRRNELLYGKIDSADIEKQLIRLNQKNESKIPWVDRAQMEINKWIE